MEAKSFRSVMNDGVCRFIVSPGCKTESQGYFTEQRIDRSTVPQGWYIYDIRTTDLGSFYTLENHVLVNYGGSFITKTPVKMNSKGYHCLVGRGSFIFAR